MTPTYRPDIDGLRAIAVLSVILGHFGFTTFSGGYVGVDIFFVISGFLITTIIIREIGAGSFSISTFYERRFRRILPAILACVAATMLVGFFLLDTAEYDNLLQSAIANNVYVANIFFYLETGYFDNRAELKPLLHTWSLSVEEQYYLFFPIILLVIAKFSSKRYLPWLATIGILSLVASVFGMSVNASAVFYLLPTRAWELMIGSLLAIVAVPKNLNKNVLNALAVLGVGLMAYSVMVFTDETPFPGAAATLPAFGAGFVILAGSVGETWVSRALAVKPMVFVGLISYSLYLWHWPILVYSKYLKVVELTLLEKAALIATVFVVSTLSWRFVETPFRKKKILAGKKSIFIAAGVVTAVFIGISIALLQADEPEWNRWKNCEEVPERLAENEGLCSIGAEAESAQFLLWGDSHARALAPAIDSSAQRSGASGVIATHSACPPLLGIDRLGRSECNDFNTMMLDYVRRNDNITTIILASRWALSANGTRYKTESGNNVTLVDITNDPNAAGDGPALIYEGLTRTIAELEKLKLRIVIIGQVPEVGYDVRAANQSALRTDRDVNDIVAPSYDEYIERNKQVISILDRVKAQSTVALIMPATTMCDEQRCRVALDGGKALYRDDNHLSIFGAKHISPIFDSIFQSGQ